MKTALAFGSFDILHPGHLHYLKAASRYGRLIVIVARDSSIRKLKGRSPVMDENSRLELVGSLKFVDKAVLGGRIRRWNDAYNILLEYKPDFLVFGYDQNVDMDYLHGFLARNGIRPRIVRLKAHNKKSHKSTLIRKALGI
jgi:FAD synthetase